MTAFYYAQPKLLLFDRAINLKPGQDVIKCGLVNGSIPARSTTEGYEYVSDLLGGVAEASGTGYSRLTMTTTTLATSALITTLSITAPSPITWSSSTITATGAFWYDETASAATDATRPLLVFWDFGGAQSSSNGNFTLTLASNVLVTFTSAA